MNFDLSRAEAVTSQVTNMPGGGQVVRVLLDERDQYLAWCLHRSKAVNGAERVVGVVGLAHLRGIAFHLQNSDGNLRFKDLVGRSAHL